MSSATPAGSVSIQFSPDLSAVEAALAEVRKGYEIPLRAKWVGPNGEPAQPTSAVMSTPAPTTFASAKDAYVGPGGTGAFTGPSGLAFTVGQGFSTEFETPADRAAPKYIGPAAPKVDPSQSVAGLGLALTAAEQKTIAMKEAAIGPTSAALADLSEKSAAREGLNLASPIGAVPPALTAAAERMLHAAEQMERAAAIQERSTQRLPSSVDRPQRDIAAVAPRKQRSAARDLGLSEVEATAIGIPAAEEAIEEVTATRASRQRGGMPFMIPRGPRSIFAQGGRALSRSPLGGAAAFGAAFAGYELYQGAENLSVTYNQRRVAELRGQTIFQQAGEFANQASEVRGTLLGRGMEAFADSLRSALPANAEARSRIPEFLTRARTSEEYFSSIERAGQERDFLHASRREDYQRSRGIREAGEANPFARERLGIQTQSAIEALGIGERYNTELLKYNDVNDPQQAMRNELEKERRQALEQNDALYRARLRGQHRDESAQYRAQSYTSRGQTIANAARLRGDVQGALSAEAYAAYQSFGATEAQKYDLKTPEGKRARDTALESLFSGLNTQGEIARRQESAERTSLAGQTQSLRLQLSRRPLEAQISEIESESQAAMVVEPREEFRQQIRERSQYQQALVARQFNDRTNDERFALQSETEHFDILSGSTRESQGQQRGTRRLLAEVQDITSRVEQRRRRLIEEYGGTEAERRGLLSANAREGRSQLNLFRTELTESVHGEEINPYIRSTSGIGTLDMGAVQRKIRAAFSDVGSESKDLPGDKKPTDPLSAAAGAANSPVAQSITQIQANSTTGLQVIQQMYAILQQLNLQVA